MPGMVLVRVGQTAGGQRVRSGQPVVAKSGAALLLRVRARTPTPQILRALEVP